MPTISLVDNDRDTLAFVSRAFEAEGYRTQTYNDSASALVAMQQNAPDAAVLEIDMPRINGTELMRRLRKNSNVPVIFLTSKHNEFEELSGFKMGADDVIRKPFSHRVLMERVKAVLRRSQLTEAAAVNDVEAYIIRRGSFAPLRDRVADPSQPAAAGVL